MAQRNLTRYNLMKALTKAEPEAVDKFLTNLRADGLGDGTLVDSFHWWKSEEGFDYWKGICDRLPKSVGWGKE